MGIRETLQDALVGANNDRIEKLEFVQELNSRALDFKIALQRAETQRASFDSVRDLAKEKYREFLDYANTLSDPDARNALGPEIDRLVRESNSATRNASVAFEATRDARIAMDKLLREQAVAQANLDTANRHWEQIKKQLGQLS
jgi:hypothetical protein